MTWVPPPECPVICRTSGASGGKLAVIHLLSDFCPLTVKVMRVDFAHPATVGIEHDSLDAEMTLRIWVSISHPHI